MLNLTDNYLADLKEIVPDVSRETLAKLLEYQAELLSWNQQFNLISKNDAQAEIIWHRHMLDSAQLQPIIANYNYIIDIGSGSGFPSIVLAILNQNRQNFSIELIEKLAKKAKFLEYVVNKLALPAKVRQIRIENYRPDQAGINGNLAVISRAFANLAKIFSSVAAILQYEPNVTLILPKGSNWAEEVSFAQKTWEFSLETIKSKLQDDSVILKINKLKHK